MEKKKIYQAHPNEKLIEQDIQTQECAHQARTSNELAKRDPITERYDLLDPDFLRCMALIGGFGARKYGDRNWQLSELTGNKSPINHIMKHLVAYQNHEQYDHPEIGDQYWIHLAAIAFNAMMQFYHEIQKYPEE